MSGLSPALNGAVDMIEQDDPSPKAMVACGEVRLSVQAGRA